MVEKDKQRYDDHRNGEYDRRYNYTNNRGWRMDRSVSILTIITIFTAFMGLVTFSFKQDTRISILEEQQRSQDLEIARISRETKDAYVQISGQLQALTQLLLEGHRKQ